MGTPPPQLRTAAVIAREVGTHLPRVQHVLATHPDIRPVAYADTVPVYDSGVVAQVRYAINLEDARRCRRRGGTAHG